MSAPHVESKGISKIMPRAWQRVWPLVILAAVSAGAFWLSSSSEQSRWRNAGLVIEEQFLNFGETWEQNKFLWKLPITNRNAEKVEILGFAASCSCIEVQPYTFVLEPNERREVELTVDLTYRGREGVRTWDRSFQVTLIPQIKGASVRLAGWKLAGKVKIPLLFDPPHLDFGEKPVFYGQSIETKVVRVFSQTPLDDLTCRWNTKNGAAMVERVPGKDSEYLLKVTPDKSLVPGVYSQVIQVVPTYADAREVGPVSLPCRIEVLPDINVDPINLVLVREQNSTVDFATARISSRSGRRVTRCEAQEEPRTTPKGLLKIALAGKEGEDAFIYKVTPNLPKGGIEASAIRFRLFLEGHDIPSEARTEVLLGTVGLPRGQNSTEGEHEQ